MAGTQSKITSREDLEAFFEDCDFREEGVEPDWEEHLARIEQGGRSGAADLDQEEP
jgi:hypothetical protein